MKLFVHSRQSKNKCTGRSRELTSLIWGKVFSESARQIVDSGVAFTPIIAHPINCYKANVMALGNHIRMNTIKKANRFQNVGNNAHTCFVN